MKRFNLALLAFFDILKNRHNTFYIRLDNNKPKLHTSLDYQGIYSVGKLMCDSLADIQKMDELGNDINEILKDYE